MISARGKTPMAAAQQHTATRERERERESAHRAIEWEALPVYYTHGVASVDCVNTPFNQFSTCVFLCGLPLHFCHLSLLY